MPLPAPWEWVDQAGNIEIVAAEDDIRSWYLSKTHGAHNVRHHLEFFEGNGYSHHVGGWVVKQKLQWLRRVDCTEYVPVLGGSALFMRNIAEARKDVDMPFTIKIHSTPHTCPRFHHGSLDPRARGFYVHYVDLLQQKPTALGGLGRGFSAGQDAAGGR